MKPLNPDHPIRNSFGRLSRAVVMAAVIASGIPHGTAGTLTASTVDAETDIVNTGLDLISAANFGEAAVTVNGIFHGAGSAAGTNFTNDTTFEGDYRNGQTGHAGVLETLFSGIAGRNGITMSISGLTVGEEYLYQAYWEGVAGTSLTVTIEGDTLNNIADAPLGVLISYQFTATDSTLNIFMDRDDNTGGDANNWLSGYSLQKAPPDTTSPAITTLSPADGSNNVSRSSRLVMTFNEPITIGTGDITLKNLSDATQTTIAITDASQVSAAGTTLTIKPTAVLVPGKNYAIQIATGAVKDLSNNSFAGITDDTTWNFAVSNLYCELDVLDLAAANGGINPATGLAWAAGDTYRLMFLTSQTTNATSTDIATYNTFVQGVAAASTEYPALRNGTWKIVGSTETVSARDNTGTNPGSGTGVAIFLTDGRTMVADNNADLWDGSLDNTVSLDENASPLVEDRAFTGSYFNGTSVSVSDPDKPLGVLDGSGVQTGASNSANFWIRQWKDTATNVNSVYAMSDPLTVQSAASNFASWISNPGFGLDPLDQGFGIDADDDGLANGVEAWFGTNPGSSNAGLVSTGKSGSVFSFQHPETDPPLSDVSGSYEWSINLVTWNSPGTIGDTTVAITATPNAGTTTVQADTAGSVVPPVKLFVRGVATQN